MKRARIFRRAASSGSDVGDVLGELVVPQGSHVRPAGEWLPSRRLRALRMLALLCLSILAIRSGFLQLSLSASYRHRAEENRVRFLVDYAPRGVMFDRFGTQLVENVPSTDVVVYPSQLPSDTEGIITALREVFPEMSAADLSQRLARVDRALAEPLPLRADISHDQLVALLARQEKTPGIGIEHRAVRAYPGQDFAHTLGYTGRISEEEYNASPGYLLTESIGKSGLERMYETMLRGTHGARRVEVDAVGNVQKDLGSLPSQPGANLRLHIDAELQHHLVEALRHALQTTGSRRAAAVALDPRNGAVRALVSLPTYDHSALSRGLKPEEASQLFSDTTQPLLNRATQGRYPPGSTFKIAVAAAGIEEGLITPQSTVSSTGGIRVGQWFFPDWKPGGHGMTDIVKAIAESVNTFFYTFGGGFGEQQGLGIQRITHWAERMGFGDVTHIDLPEERDGFLPSPEWKEKTKKEAWYIGDTYHAAIGQGDILVTPLQLAVATSVVANGGTLYEPRLLDALVRTDGSVIEQRPGETRAQRVLAPETIALLQRAMRETVLSGSGRALSTLPVSASGKTGTAQTPVGNATHAWFTSFAPAETPELVLTVLVEEGGDGDRIAAPVAREVLQWYFTREKPEESSVNS